MVKNHQVHRNEEPPFVDGVNGEKVNDLSGGETQVLMRVLMTMVIMNVNLKIEKK